jgi:sugar lactone lactonase YvrE
MFISEAGNSVVRAVDSAGRIRTVAGAQGLTQQGDALVVSINQPGGLALDRQGRLLISELASGTVKRLDQQVLTVVAGTTKGNAGDGCPATQAQLSSPTGLAFIGDDLYIIDPSANRLRKVNAQGIISLVAGQSGSVNTERFQPALSARMSGPSGLVAGPDGLLYWTDTNQHQVRRLNADQTVETLAGSLELVDDENKSGDAGDGGAAVDALLNAPGNLAFDSKGNLYVADVGNLKIRKIDTAGKISTFAGLPVQQAIVKLFSSPNEEGIDAKQAALVVPFALCVDANDNLYVAEIGTSDLARLSQGKTLPLDTLPPVAPRIRKITPDGKISTVVGPGSKAAASRDAMISLRIPLCILIDGEGRLVVADSGLNQVFLIPKSAL